MSDSKDSELLENTTGLSYLSRAMSTSDIPAVYEIEQRAHSHPWKQVTFERRVAGTDFCRLILQDECILAYAIASYGGGDAELLNIVVDPRHQRKGIAGLLLSHIQALVAPHADMMFLEVRVSNQKAIDLYQCSGFFETGHRNGYYPTVNGREDALLMACQLDI